MTDPHAVQQAIARAGHDLNNACASLLGFAALALDGAAHASPLRQQLVEIDAAAKRAARIADDLLTLSRQLQDHPDR